MAPTQPMVEEELNCHGVRNSILMINSFQITVYIKKPSRRNKNNETELLNGGIASLLNNYASYKRLYNVQFSCIASIEENISS